MSNHDAYLQYNDTRVGEVVSWGWTSGRRTVTPDEHDAVKEYTAKGEDKDFSQYESGDTMAHIWMNDDETVDRIEWL